ncbi:secreted RxLR effector protein 161-like [Nicotiana tomentosiformis]|uniref:secreted RxLR effector protein 161-like n=1 Tax=Nicotiana tomentosiformis TaxID=4098 RepID=UPI00388C39CD
MYVKKQGTSDFLVVYLYVDDMIYKGSCETLVAEFKSCMMKEFEMSDLGTLQYFLGLQVKQEKDGIFVSQRKYVKNLLLRFGMQNCKVAAIPMSANKKLQLEDGTDPADPSYYRSLIGGLNYLTHTRPDIIFSVSVLSRYASSPSKQHLGAAKRVLRYVVGTVDFGIWYSKDIDLSLIGYSDNDWAGSIDYRKSTYGNVCSLGSRVISWCSQKQDAVALSSSEAYYVAVTSAVCQAIWLRRLLVDVRH